MTIWPTTQLDRLCEVTSSKRIYASELTPFGVPFYRSKEIIERLNGRDVVSTPLFISEARFQEILRTSGAPQAGDLLLTSRGTLGVPYVVQSKDRFHFADGNLTWFRNFRGIDGIFLKYFFLSPRGKSELLKCVIGSSQAAYTIVSLKKIELPLPPPSIQRRIVAILSAYDDLIENNTRRITILEEMARLVYDEWFVRFRFPGHEGVRMVESELGPAPLGWNPSSILDVCRFVKGVEPGRSAYQLVPAEGLIAFLRVGDLSKRSAELFVDRSLTRGNELAEEDIAVSLDGTVGVVRYGLRGAYSGGIRKVMPTKPHCGRAFLYQYLRSDYAQGVMRAHANGATILHAGGSINHLKIAMPPPETLQAFEELVLPMMRQVIVLEKTNANVRITRDFLLPKLFSGELDVSAVPDPEALAA